MKSFIGLFKVILIGAIGGVIAGESIQKYRKVHLETKNKELELENLELKMEEERHEKVMAELEARSKEFEEKSKKCKEEKAACRQRYEEQRIKLTEIIDNTDVLSDENLNALQELRKLTVNFMLEDTAIWKKYFGEA